MCEKSATRPASKRNPKPSGELRPLLGVPGGHSNAELKNTHPAERTIYFDDTPQPIEINVTPSRASACPLRPLAKGVSQSSLVLE